MQCLFIVPILFLYFDAILTIGVFMARPTKPSTTNRQGRAHPRQAHLHNNNTRRNLSYPRDGPYHRGAHDTTRLNHRSRLQDGKKVVSQQSTKSTVTQRLTYPHPQRVIHPRFRPIHEAERNGTTKPTTKMSSSSSQKSQIQKQIGQPPPANALVTVNTTATLPSTHPLPATSSAQNQSRAPLADYPYQEQIRAFFKHYQEQPVGPTRSRIKTGLR